MVLRGVLVILLCLAMGCSASVPRQGASRPSVATSGSPTGKSVPQGTKRPATARPYTVLGRTYHPVASAHGYVETGTASWYGRDFHGRPTACGERYDMYGISAAHKLLPMHTRVRVTNLDNGRQLVVRINDRGPFVKSRILDLSYGAAKELKMARAGTARVRVEALGGGRPDLSGGYYVQVGAFTVRSNALRLVDHLKGRGYGLSRVQQVTLGGQLFWRVQAGRFQGLDRARTGLARLQMENPSAFILAD